MPMALDQPFRFGDRYVSETDCALLRTTIRELPQLRRSELTASWPGWNETEETDHA